jgi:hypothetical protein
MERFYIANENSLLMFVVWKYRVGVGQKAGDGNDDARAFHADDPLASALTFTSQSDMHTLRPHPNSPESLCLASLAIALVLTFGFLRDHCAGIEQGTFTTHTLWTSFAFRRSPAGSLFATTISGAPTGLSGLNRAHMLSAC